MLGGLVWRRAMSSRAPPLSRLPTAYPPEGQKASKALLALNPVFSVVIVGRPNVGKSSLFNRLVGERQALVDNMANTTRDVHEGVAVVSGLPFKVMDTAGLEDVDSSRKLMGRRKKKAIEDVKILNEDVSSDAIIREQMFERTAGALRSANVALFVVDVREGITPWDKHFASWIRKNLADSHVAVVLVANKCEGEVLPKLSQSGSYGRFSVGEALSLGFGPPVCLSAEHGDGLVHLMERLFEQETRVGLLRQEGVLPPLVPLPLSPSLHPSLRLTVLGRPNTGKSSLVNSLLGSDRVVVGDMPGVTRDSIEIKTEWTVPEHLRGLACLRTPGEEQVSSIEAASSGRSTMRVSLIDTAGIYKGRARDPASVSKGHEERKRLEYQTYKDTLRQVKFAHVVVLVVDLDVSGFNVASSSIDDLLYFLQYDRPVFHLSDSTLINQVVEHGRSLVVAVTKWDCLGALGSMARPEGVVEKAGSVAHLAPGEKVLKLLSHQLDYVLPAMLRDPPLVPVSALPEFNSDPSLRKSLRLDLHPMANLWPVVLETYDRWTTRIPTGPLNNWLQPMVHQNKPPLKVKYATQVSTGPPTFVIFHKHRKGVAPGGVGDVWANYFRFLANELRKEFDLGGVTLRMKGKGSHEAETDDHGKKRVGLKDLSRGGSGATTEADTETPKSLFVKGSAKEGRTRAEKEVRAEGEESSEQHEEVGGKEAVREKQGRRAATMESRQGKPSPPPPSQRVSSFKRVSGGGRKGSPPSSLSSPLSSASRRGASPSPRSTTKRALLRPAKHSKDRV